MSSRAFSFGIEGCDGLLDGRPFLLTNFVLGYPCLKTSLVSVRARIADVLIAICLGKEDGQTDTACDFGMGRIEAFNPRNCGPKVDNVFKWRIGFLRIGGRRLHDAVKIFILVDKRLIVGIEICRRNFVFVGPSDSGRQHVGKVFVRAHHGDAGKIECLSRFIRQLLIRIDLCAPLPQDRPEVLHCFVVGIERIRL